MPVTVFTTTDRLEGESVCAMLRSHGLEATLVGVVDPARLGVGAHILPVEVVVPDDDAARAKELISAEADAPEPAAAAEPEPPRRRERPIVALGVPVIFPGLGHVYVGRPWTGALLAAAVVLGFVVTKFGDAAVGVYLVSVIVDGVRSARLAARAPVSRGLGRQVVEGLALVALTAGLANGPKLVTAARHELLARHVAQVTLECSAKSLALTNTTSRAVELGLGAVSANVQVTLFEEEVAGVTGVPAALRLEAGQRAEFPITIEEGATCAPEPSGVVFEAALPRHRLGPCELVFPLVLDGTTATVSCSFDAGAGPAQLRHHPL